jgi:uncharacterized protein (DUF1800 family)
MIVNCQESETMLLRRKALQMMGAVAVLPYVANQPAKAAVSPHDLALVDALTWGANQSTMVEFQSLDREKWVQSQLHPPAEPRLPQAAQQRVDALMAIRKPMMELEGDFDAIGRVANEISDQAVRAEMQKSLQDGMGDIVHQASTASILRALYAPDQLRERMTWFWLNHFNVYQYKANIRVLIGDYEQTAIRKHAMGRFRDLLMATLKHPAMLRYLDNADNAVGHVNENYAREIMELHTLGVGSGYTQQDVEQLAAILTGVGIDPRPVNPTLKPEWQTLLVREGPFEFNPARHDFNGKMFLGQKINGGGFAEVVQALDMLCAHPATARHIAHQIAVYFVADDPPASLIDRMTQSFMRTQGDITSVLDTMISAPEFAASLGTRFKDPVRYIYSAVRLAYDDKVIVNTAPVQAWLNKLAEGLYNHQTPDGYAMEASAWDSSGEMMTRFEIARQIGTNSAGLFKAPGPDGVEEPAFPLLQNGLYFDGLRATLSAETRAALDKATSPQEWNTLFLCSPEFMR